MEHYYKMQEKATSKGPWQEFQDETELIHLVRRILYPLFSLFH